MAVLAEQRLIALFWLVCLVVVFTNLGETALFEPDEGRNAEKAREILLLRDWVTPHENFLTTLDKPMFYYWLVAVSFKVFGISEWSARLPSAVATLGCVFLVYRFARLYFGLWEALWSCLVMLTSFEFFLFSRIVIFDMTLTFFIALALFAFYKATRADSQRDVRLNYMLMYTAMGMGTLVKGPIGLVVPGMVVCFYLLATRKWSLMKKINPLFGAVIYFSIVAPWYLWVELRNPGYLKYFLWEEHFVRFATPYFDRSQSGYYFFLVIATGFLPWSPLLPFIIKDLWRRSFNDAHLFLTLWGILPFIFFSVSNAKQPQYVLPIFPALAVLTGQTVATRTHDPTNKQGWVLYVPWAIIFSFVFYLLVGAMWPGLLLSSIRSSVTHQAFVVSIYGAILCCIYASYMIGRMKGIWRDAGAAYLCTCIGIALFLLLSGQIVKAASFHRAAKPLAEKTAPLIKSEDQLVFYDTYLEGMPFYLRVGQPIWIVERPRERESIAERRRVPAVGYGKVMYTLDEFAEQWQRNEKVFRVFLREKSLARFSRDVGTSPRVLSQINNEYFLVTNR